MTDHVLMAFVAWENVFGLAGSERELIIYISYSMIAVSVIVVCTSQFVGSPYGRYAESASSIWGIGVHAKSAWFIQEFPSFCLPLLLILCSDTPLLSELPNKILLGIFFLHYFQRTFIYSLLIKGGKRTPLIVFLLAVLFCTTNGYLQARYLLKYADFGSEWKSRPNFHIGIAIFFVGMFINIQSDSILRNLRKPGETGYKIPTGGMFHYVSGANFLGEIIEWTGFAVASCTLPALSFALFTAANLGPRAYQHHQWYKKKFDDYPPNRKAIIPFIL